MLRRCIILPAVRNLPFVLDSPFVVPSPIDEPCLTDVSWRTFLDTPKFKGKIHQPANLHDTAICAISPTFRSFALMPTMAKSGNSVTCVWSPFLVDTGSRQTYFCAKTRELLRMDISDSVSVLNIPVQWACSTNHFEDINLLGTDVLHYGVLRIDYPQIQMDFNLTRKDIAQSDSNVWVKYGTAVFEVTPAKNHVDSLKKAVKSEMPSTITKDAPLLTVKDGKGNVLKASEPLQANTEETAYIVE